MMSFNHLFGLKSIAKIALPVFRSKLKEKFLLQKLILPLICHLRLKKKMPGIFRATNLHKITITLIKKHQKEFKQVAAFIYM